MQNTTLTRTTRNSITRVARRTLTFTATLTVIAIPAHAQGSIGAERPGITLPPSVLERNRFQIEMGLPNVSFTRGSGQDNELWNFPVQMRYGFTGSTELRLFSTTWNRFNDNASGGDDFDGIADVEIGTKTVLTEGGGSDPKTALVTALHLPTGDDSFTTHQLGYGLTLAAQWQLSDTTSLTGLAGITRTPVGDENALTGALAVSYGVAIDERFGTYAEFGWYPDIDNSVDTGVVGTGLTYLVNDDTQLDAFGDFGLNSDTPDATIGLGLSLRF